LLYKTEIDKKFISELVKKYNFPEFRKRVENIIKNSKKEYGYFFPEAENARELKKLKTQLFKTLR